MKHTVRRPHYARWRALTLVGVYLLMVGHVIHWCLAGRTLAPLELNEVMYTLECGIVTAGFLFMALLVAATAVFGRFFCSWGCHILALEDLAFWGLGKLGIRPKPVRLRLLRWVPLAAMFYMFVWPQIVRVLHGLPAPALHLRTDEQGWASFVTADFARNLPGPGVAILTFVVCGFLMVYVLGSRAFCTYACPYGAIFRIADRFAVGRIVARGDCSRCGKCTSVCQSDVQVHQELMVHGRVVNPACMKDLDCVAACPQGNVAYGFARPALFELPVAGRIQRPAYDLSLAEEIALAGVFLATFFAFRGLYGIVPFLLSLAIGGILAYLAVVAVRLARRPRQRLSHLHLKRDGRITAAGWAFTGLALSLAVFTVHSGIIRYHEYRAERLLQLDQRAATDDPSARVRRIEHALRDLAFCQRWSLVPPRAHSLLEASLLGRLGEIHAQRRELAAAADCLRRSLDINPNDSLAHYNYGVVLSLIDRPVQATHHYQCAARLNPDDADIHNNLGLLLSQQSQWTRGAAHLERAIALRPGLAHPHFNLGRLLIVTGRPRAGWEHLETAARLDPEYAKVVAELRRDWGLAADGGATRAESPAMGE